MATSKCSIQERVVPGIILAIIVGMGGYIFGSSAIANTMKALENHDHTQDLILATHEQKFVEIEEMKKELVAIHRLLAARLPVNLAITKGD